MTPNEPAEFLISAVTLYNCYLYRVARGPKFETQARPAARIFITFQPAARNFSVPQPAARKKPAQILFCPRATLYLYLKF